MDRQIVYPGAIPLDTDILNLERSAMVALGYLAQMILGTNVIADGLICLPAVPASLAVTVGPGSITQYGVVDTVPFGSLPAEPDEPLLLIGVTLSYTNFQVSAPTGAGQAINYLIEASLLETDATPVTLPYYNASNPAQPFSGPSNSGTAQYTQRLQEVQLQLKAGAAAAAGSQQTPPVDTGYVGLWSITVQTGQTAVIPANIVQLPTAPFITWKLPQLSPGTQHLEAFSVTAQGSWTVPSGVTMVKVRAWGGGGAGGNGFTGAGGGGAGGGYSEGYYAVAPGQTITVEVGSGGVGAAGGASSFGSFATAGGGDVGAIGNSAALIGAGGANGGSGSGVLGSVLVAGQAGGAGFLVGTLGVGGAGGGAFGGPGAAAVAFNGASGGVAGNGCTVVGGGGGGGVLNGLGGNGGPGQVIVEW